MSTPLHITKRPAGFQRDSSSQVAVKVKVRTWPIYWLSLANRSLALKCRAWGGWELSFFWKVFFFIIIFGHFEVVAVA